MVPVGTAQRRYTASGEELMTLAVLGLRDRGLDVDEVQQWFLNRPGYVNLQWNDRIGGIFVRFSSFVDADRALHDAGARGYGAEWARRNLDDDRGAATAWPPARFPAQPQAYGAQQAHRTLQAHGAPQAYGAPSFHGAAPYQQGGPPPKRPRGIVGELATIAVLGFNVKQGSFPDSLQDYFRSKVGFVALQMNDRVDGLFVKFATAALAEQAMSEANAINLGAEWARRNLDL